MLISYLSGGAVGGHRNWRYYGQRRVPVFSAEVYLGGYEGEANGLARLAMDPAHHSALAVVLADPLSSNPGARRAQPNAAALLPLFVRDSIPFPYQSLPAALMRWICGACLALSLWYVAQRLYGNGGGLVALAFFVVSAAGLSDLYSLPTTTVYLTWGVFGSVFCAVAVAHTLYAPRPVIVWNYKRIAMLGVSLALAIGCDYIFLLLIPLVLSIMWYLAPMRKLDAFLILLSAGGVMLATLWVCYGFSLGALWAGLVQPRPLAIGPDQEGPASPLAILPWLGMIVAVLAVASAVTCALWRRARYFGNVGPLLVAASLISPAFFVPAEQSASLWLASLPFLCQAVGGVASDLLETRARRWLAPALVLALGLQAYLTFSSFYY